MKCWAWEECEAFTFSYGQGCVLLTDKLTDVQHDKQESNFATSGPKYCTSDGQRSTEGGREELTGGCIARGCHYYATPVDVISLGSVATPFRCQALCQQYEACIVFSYDYSTQLCTLHATEEKKTTGVTPHQLCGPR
ncbi:unnamed protein product [Vitrella brassicaformis CCMP3155]|uniref:Apple domain-containing protein n=1 Tax=Vitrella brassicaformis (strain CCMP3155) TaxID=1169540 RepID=A0A0G4EP61_VITBC|nr:unnamed protein product [Vitrella brassicaformis CCMP3155]|eukprot:CEL99214.1 unnamed protein product [Vitrella brassicaformis CCMP3155]